jgi:hypothetical protein
MTNMNMKTTNVSILKVSDCPSLSARSTLTYHLGRCPEGRLYLRLFHNTGSGFFSNEWMPVVSIETLLEQEVPLTSTSFKKLYPGKSVNTAGFLMAALFDLGVIRSSHELKRQYVTTDKTLTGAFSGLEPVIVPETMTETEPVTVPKKGGRGRTKAKPVPVTEHQEEATD